MKTVVFATNNKHKLDEVRKITDGLIRVVSLEEIDCQDEIPETADTLEGNALLKAQYIKEQYGYDCFADDTGLEVEALGNAPGVYSARYAGPACNARDNMEKLLAEMDGMTNRKARFRTAIAFLSNGDNRLFEGIISGSIITEKKGSAGFGYDPLFQPEGYDQTFAELGEDIKNTISHRAIAVRKFADYLSTLSE